MGSIKSTIEYINRAKVEMEKNMQKLDKKMQSLVGQKYNRTE